VDDGTASRPTVGQVAPEEGRWALAFGLLAVTLTSLPYLLGYAVQGEAWRFTGFVFGVQDGNSYIAKMLGGAGGAWLFRTPYTTAVQGGLLAFLPYILLGKLSAPPGQHEQLVALFHIFRAVGGLLMARATYDFLAIFLQEPRQRRWGTALATLGGGLGWAAFLPGLDGRFPLMPLEWYSPESFGFLALFGLPHLATARALLLWSLRVYLLPPAAQERPAGLGGVFQSPGIAAGALLLGVGLMQPITVLAAWAVMAAHLAALGAWLAWRNRPGGLGRALRDPVWRRFVQRAMAAGLISLPLVAYTTLAFRFDPYLRAWQAQNLILSPPWPYYLLAYGLLLPFAALGAFRLVERQPETGCLPAAWALLLPFLAYAPFNLQRRLPEGVFVALAALALAGMASLRGGFSWARLATALSLPSSALLLAGGLLAASSPGLPLFRPADEVRLFEALGATAEQSAGVLSAYQTGNALSAWAPLTVVIGHGPETANLDALRWQAAGFFSLQWTSAERLAFIRVYHVRYIFWGPEERALGGWDPGSESFLRLAAQQGSYTVYEVIQDE
jgi:hypothetical protein